MSAVGNTRRLQALYAVGWSHIQLGRIFVISRCVITKAIHGDGEIDDPFIAALYPNLVNGPFKPSPHVLQGAKKAGYAPPEEWEGLDIDDESIHAQRHRAVPRKLHGPELAEYVELRINGKELAVETCRGAGYSEPERVAELLARMRQAPLGRALLNRYHADHCEELRQAARAGGVPAGVG